MKIGKENIRLFAVTVILALYALGVTEKYWEKRQLASTLERTVDNYSRKAVAMEARLNDSVTVQAARVADLALTKKNIENRYDSLLKAVSLRAKEVERVVEIRTVTRDSIVETPVYYDSFGGLKVSHSDEWARITVRVDSSKTARIDYEISDSLVVVSHQKRHSILFGLIKWKETKATTVIPTNPKTHVRSVTAVERYEK